MGLNTWHSKDSGPAPERAPSLYHTAILYPERKDLAAILRRLLEAKYPITGTSDHGVSEAIYLDDPDKNGVQNEIASSRSAPRNDKWESLFKSLQ